MIDSKSSFGVSLFLLQVFLLLPLQWVAQLSPAEAFQTLSTVTAPTRSSQPTTTTIISSSSSSSGSDDKETAPASAVVTVATVLKDNYPAFYSLLSKNKNIFETLEKDSADSGYTIFAPNKQAFEELGEKKRAQIEDPRNLETAQKMGLYHVVSTEPLSLTQLNREDWTVPKTPEGLPALKFGALVTMGGEVPIGRFKKKTEGGFFRSLVGKEKTVKDKDGNALTEIVVGPEGTIKRSVKVGNAIIHEVDGFVSPYVLWRYCDQLRIPGF